MNNFFFYAHGGSGNHGCEAIVRSSARILHNQAQGRITLISANPDEDQKYGLDQICTIIKDRTPYSKKSISFLKAYLVLKLKHDYVPMDQQWYKESFSHIQEGDIAFSIGGDNYCYINVSEYIMLHDMLKQRKAKTVLWGCSVEPAATEKSEIAADLARYDLITARETISYNALKKVNPNTILVADPAFCLQLQETEIPARFIPGNTVGINLSPMAIENEAVPGIAFESFKNLIAYILKNTNLQIALIPHVVWDNGDDRGPLHSLYEVFKGTGRIVMIEDRSCQELKYIISKCRFFIGARTHSTIAAYSTGVPTLVLGYSVKARGIARDLFGTEENYVVPVQDLTDSEALSRNFEWLLKNENQIRKRLKEVIPAFIERASDIKLPWM